MNVKPKLEVITLVSEERTLRALVRESIRAGVAMTADEEQAIEDEFIRLARKPAFDPAPPSELVSVPHEHLSDLMFRMFRAEGLVKISLRVIDNENAGEPMWCELERTLESVCEILLKAADEISSQYVYPLRRTAENGEAS